MEIPLLLQQKTHGGMARLSWPWQLFT